MTERAWNIVDADRAIAWREYSFSKGAYATTLVFRGTDGLVVVSPPSRVPAADFDALAELGEVRALVANNTFHHLGQAEWRARFPNAVSYAAPSALKRLGKKSAAIPYRPIDELELPSHAKAVVLPGTRNGEVLFSVKGDKGAVWYTGDLLANIQRTPGPPFSWLFKWTDSAPGFRLFKLSVWLFVKDKKAVKERMTQLLAEEPPVAIVPGHGPALVDPAIAGEAKEQLGRL
jgi:glyoxylase-like metal-dependent hydrolase (beta-lactamase superfamily II)